MNYIEKGIVKADEYQRQHRFSGFFLAVIKKYGDDQAGQQAGLLVYYGFLSLFPLLLVVATVLQIILGSDPGLKASVVNSLTDSFPVVGKELQRNVHTFHKTGLALAIGILFTLYGARGGADAFRGAVNHIWQIPRSQRAGFPLTVLKNLAVVVVGGLGLVVVLVTAGYGVAPGRGFLGAFLVLFSLVLLFGLFIFLLKVSLPKEKTFKDRWLSAAIVAVGMGGLQIIGSYLVARQLKHLDSLYGTFALVLGILFWLYLQVQVILYALEISSVRQLKLWPRSLVSGNLTTADKRAYELYAQRDRFIAEENIQATFKN